MAGDGPSGDLEQRTIAAAGNAARETEGKPGEQAPEGPREAGSALKEWVGLLARAAFWALVIYQFVFQVSVVRGSSMEPNFKHGDRLLIDKLAYRFTELQPGDVIVFEAMVRAEARFDPEEKRIPRDFIKRVIARPGDTVKIYAGALHVNGVTLDESGWAPKAFGGMERFAGAGSAGEIVVPPGRYFVMGDNRSEGGSEDSRGRKIGYVHERQIKGKVRWRFYPFDALRWF